MRISIDEPATCGRCVFFETPDLANPKHGNCAVVCDDGQPPCVPFGGLPPSRTACVFFHFDRRKEQPDEN